MLHRYFLFIAMPMYGFSFLWMIGTGQYSLENPGVYEHLMSYFYFVCGLILGSIFIFTIIKISPKKQMPSRLDVSNLLNITKTNNLVNIIGAITSFFSLIYVFDGGYEKILLLGSNMDSLDFRYMGLNDRSKFIAVPMELSRRILLPFVILAKLSLQRFNPSLSKWPLILMIIVFLLVSLINLDRGPIFTFIVLLVFYIFSTTNSLFKKVMLLISAVTLVGFIGSLVTFLQYNNTDFTFKDIINTLEGILINRIMLSPIKMSQGWVFDYLNQFQDPLLFEYARISVLWGGGYIGSHHSSSFYVAPVGCIGDLYRNLGAPFLLLIVGLFIGAIFLFVQNRIQRLPEEIRIPMNFIALILAMYLYYGNISSLGPFAIFIFLVFVPIILKVIIKKYHTIL